MIAGCIYQSHENIVYWHKIAVTIKWFRFKNKWLFAFLVNCNSNNLVNFKWPIECYVYQIFFKKAFFYVQTKISVSFKVLEILSNFNSIFECQVQACESRGGRGRRRGRQGRGGQTLPRRHLRRGHCRGQFCHTLLGQPQRWIKIID